MWVGGQRHVPAALRQGKTPYPFYSRLVGLRVGLEILAHHRDSITGPSSPAANRNLGGRCGGVVSVTSRPLWPGGKIRYPFYSKLVGLRVGLEILAHHRDSITGPSSPAASRYTD